MKHLVLITLLLSSTIMAMDDAQKREAPANNVILPSAHPKSASSTKEDTVLREAATMNIPVLALVDTNNDPSPIILTTLDDKRRNR